MKVTIGEVLQWSFLRWEGEIDNFVESVNINKARESFKWKVRINIYQPFSP